MGRSRRARVALVAAALVVGLGALRVPADAAPADDSPPVAPPLGDDPLAPTAMAALTTWSTYALRGSPTLAQLSTELFGLLRDDVATAVATRLGLDAATLRAAWQRTDRAHQVALLAAVSQLGAPYHRNTRTPGVGFDCSGLTFWAWGQAGITLAHQSGTQIRAASPEGVEAAHAGDLVYYPGHVMLYLGVGNAIIHAPQRGQPVEVALLAKRHAAHLRFGNPESPAAAA